MSQINEGLKGFKTGAGISAPLAAYSRLKHVAAADANGFTGTVLLAGPNDEVVGISEHPVFVAGDHVTARLRNVSGTRKVICASICSIGDRLYGAASGQVDTLGSNGLGTAGGAIGRGEFIALEACTDAGGIVEALPTAALGAGGLLFVATGDSATVGTSSTAEAFFATNQFSIPANTLKKGDVLRIRARAVCTATNSTNTFAIILYLGGVSVAAPAAFDAADNDEVLIDATIVVKDIGATGHVKGFGVTATGAPGTAAAKEFALAATALDTTAALLVRASATVSASSAGNAVLLRDLVVELLRQ